MQLKIPLSIELADATVLRGETTTVSKNGARITIPGAKRRLIHGERLRISVVRGPKAQPARVVWLDKRSDTHYGIELDDPSDFWGVYFPTKDGNWRHQPKGRNAPVSPTPAPCVEVVPPPAVAEPQLVPQVAPEKPEQKPAKKPEAAPSNENGRVPAVVAGFSAVRLPFAERVEIAFHDAEECTALLRNLVEPGTTLRLSFAHRQAKGRVMAIARKPESGKWRVRIRCEDDA